MKPSIAYVLFWSLCLIGANLPGSDGRASVPPSPRQESILIAAAADLQYAMDSLVQVFEHDHPGIAVKATYGSSGNFFTQIAGGAPFDLFFSADMDYPTKLEDQHLTMGKVTPYAMGQIVLWSKRTDPAQHQMNTLLEEGIAKIAIANPAHAPYGKRAQESLVYYHLYDRIKDKLVFGENIAQTAQYAASGAADIGIIALSLASSPGMQATGGHYWLIPAESHQPLQQGFVLLQHAKGNGGAEKFAGFMGTSTAISILRHFGLSH